MSNLPPKGTRDFLPAQVAARRRVVATLQRVFESYGYAPLETPAIERLEVLTGKYGDEADRLIFRIQKRGEKAEEGADLGLRYDLTVPLARVIAAHADLPKPFKRYQIQPVWRAERPQRGRFREFYQCDVDCVGTTSLLADAEIIAILHLSLRELGFSAFHISLNHRAVLAAFVESFGVAAGVSAAAIRAIDKLDKIGKESVEEELAAAGLAAADAHAVVAAIRRGGTRSSFDEYAAAATKVIATSSAGMAALEEMKALRRYLLAMGIMDDRVSYDLHMARGLDYYTGPIFEVIATGEGVGSVAGGGRYDHLIARLGGPDLPAVGVSLGMERLFAVAEEMGKTADPSAPADVLVTVFDDQTCEAACYVAASIRDAGLRCELYPEVGIKLARQLSYASDRGVPFAVILGPDEAAAGTVTLRDMRRREQRAISRDDVAAAVRDAL